MRPVIGKPRYEARDVWQQPLEETAKLLEEKSRSSTCWWSIDANTSGRPVAVGHRRSYKPVKKSKIFFYRDGLPSRDGFEVEDYYNFEHEPSKDRPARDMGYFLHHRRKSYPYSHVSSSGACYGRHDFQKVTLKMIHLGVIRSWYGRCDPHHQFHQIEGLIIGKNISMADLQEPFNWSFKNVWWTSDSRHPISHSLSHLSRWMFLL